MTKQKEEELKAKAEEITKEIAAVLERHSPQPGVVYLAALSASLKLLADSIEGGGGPSAEETMNRFIEYTVACFACCNKNNA
jgi:hypothetical protein|nr:MAG TPA: hypothetical protein [Caudoviricetes sp.]